MRRPWATRLGEHARAATVRNGAPDFQTLGGAGCVDALLMAPLAVSKGASKSSKAPAAARGTPLLSLHFLSLGRFPIELVKT
jgi:hypothetical protein